MGLIDAVYVFILQHGICVHVAQCLRTNLHISNLIKRTPMGPQYWGFPLSDRGN